MKIMSRVLFPGSAIVAAMALLGTINLPSRAEDSRRVLDCRTPPKATALVEISPCLEKKSVQLHLASGRSVSGKLREQPASPCATGQDCTLEVSSRFRKRVVDSREIMAVRYRVPTTRKRAIMGWALGSATAVALTSYLFKDQAPWSLSAGDDSGLWIPLLPLTASIGTGVGYAVGRGGKVTVYVTRRPNPTPP